MKKNLIKRTLTIIALALSVVTNAGAYDMPKLADTKGQIDVYLNLDGTESSPLNITDITADRIESDLKSIYGDNKVTTPLEDNIYLRWYMYNPTTSNCLDYSNLDGSYNSKFYFSTYTYNLVPCDKGTWGSTAYSDNIARYYSSKYNNNPTNEVALKAALDLHVTFSTSYANSDNLIICEVANKSTNEMAITANEYKSSKETESSFFQLRYVIHFGKDPNGFVGNLKDNGKEVSLSVKTEKNEGAITSYSYDETNKISTANISLSKDANALNGGVTYARWYVANTAGKEISATISNNTITTTTGVTVTLPSGETYQTPAKDATNSQYWFSSKADGAGTSAIDGITVSGNYGALSGCKLVCVMSNATPGEGDFKISDGTVTEEPDWDLKYTIDFSQLPFVQPVLTSDGSEKHFYLDFESSKKTQITFSEYSQSGFTKSQILTDLGLSENDFFSKGYMRVYMLDAKGNIVPMANKESDGWKIEPSWYTNATPLGMGNNYGEYYSDNILRWYKAKGSNPTPLFTDNGKLLYRSDIIPETSGNVLVLEFADNTDGNTIVNYVGTKDNADNYYKLRYYIHFNDEFIATNANDYGTYSELSKSMVLNSKASTDAFKYDDSTSGSQTVTIDLTKLNSTAGIEFSNGFNYARWYLVQDGIAIDCNSLNGTTLTVNGGKEVTNKARYGKYIYSANAKSTDALKATLTGSNLPALDGCQLVCVMTNDLTTAIVSGDNVSHEPNYQVKYVVNFTSPYTKPSVSKEKDVYISVVNGKTEGTIDIAEGGEADGFTLDDILSELTIINNGTTVTSDNLLNNGYARWYMLDQYNVVTPLMSTDTDNWSINFGSNGIYPMGFGSNKDENYDDNILRWYKDKDSKFGIAKVFKPTLSFKDIEPAESGSVLICEITDSRGNNNNINSSTYKCNEDNILKLRYVFHFNDFIAKNAESSDYKSAEQTIALNANANNSAFQYETGKVTINLDKTKQASTLGIANGVKYARWYFVDDNGINTAAPEGVTLNVNGSKTISDITRYGQYVYTTEVSTSGISGVTVSGSDDVLKTCHLVCVMSTDGSGVLPVDATSETSLTTEPNWSVKYAINFVEDADGFLATNRTDASSYTSKSTVVSLGKDTDAFKYSETSGNGILTVNLTKDNNIQKEEKIVGGVKYIRWFFLDAEGNIATNTNTGLKVSAANGITLTQKDNYGYYWYAGSNGSAATSAMDGITISGSKENLLKYTLACVMSNDDSNANVSSGTLLHEPDWNMYYKMSLAEYVEFKHYKGYAYTHDKYDNDEINLTDGDTWETCKMENGEMKYQEVHEWEYNIYVEPGGAVTLDLPLGINPGEDKTFDSLEPFGYLRWYDYATDKKSEHITLSTDTKLHTYSHGSIIYAADNDKIKYINEGRVTFNAPSSGWTGTDIACDVSRYIDGQTDITGTTLLREPTLSFRYIFHVRPATVIADLLKEALIKSSYATPYEYKGYTTLGINPNSKADNGSTANLRVDCHDVTDYYFYSYSHSNKSIGSGETPTFGSTPIHATDIVWYAYDISGKYYMHIGNQHRSENGKLVGISTKTVTGNYTPFAGGDAKYLTFGVGDVVYICGYATDGTNMCPVSEYVVRFLEEYPMKADEISEKEPQRAISWLDKNYNLAGLINFDEDSEEANYKAPTTPVDNKTKLPSKWYLRSYAYSYAGLYDYSDFCNQNRKIKVAMSNYWAGLGCKHGEYGLFKTKGITGISNNNTGVKSPNNNDYYNGWYTEENTPFYDRTYALDGRYGYFLYVDASEEARPVCMTTFDTKLCAGSSVVISAAVASITDASTMPQLMFHLYGADYDNETGEYIKGSLIHSFATCDFKTVIDGDVKQGVWYQVYGKVTLQQNTNVESYDSYIVEVDNYGANTQGNDFAIDDIRIYQSNTNILATQDAPMCAGDEKGKVTFKIRHESIVAKFGVVEQWKTKKLRWQVRKKSDGSVVTGVSGYKKDENNNTLNYGEVTVYRNSSNIEDSAIPESEMTNGRYTTINGEIYIVLANGAELEAGDYYISASMQRCTDNADAATKDEDFGTWGAPDPEANCTVYSDYFTIGQQQLSVTTSNTTSNSSIVKDCSSDKLLTVKTDDKGNTTTSDNATISASMTVPDPINGGNIAVSDALYDWYVGTNSKFLAATGDNSAKLSEALTAFRQNYPTATSYEQTAKETTVGEGNNAVTYKYDATAQAVLKKFVDDGLLFLGKSSITLTKLKTTTKTQYFYLMPLVQEVEMSYTNSKGETAKQKVAICTDGQELSLSVTTNGPTLNLGFADVTYPTSAGNRAVRLGLDHHLNKMSGTTGTQLRLPVHDYTHKEVTTTGFNLKAGDGTKNEDGTEKNNILYVNASNDPTWTETLKTKTVTAATIEGIDAHYVYIKFDKTLPSGLAFHEGYWYDVDFTIYDSKEEVASGASHCTGDVFFRLKVVPEYVTWTGDADENYGSTNWNNDENWTRSKTEELYKGESYVNYGKQNSDGTIDYTKLSQQKSYVPMKFTKVTVPTMSNFRYAYLAKMETKDNGILKDGCLSNADSYAATEYIQYDLMAKMEADTEDENESGTMPTEKAFGCEKFYGNTCEQIYFKPEAELRQQQYLTYEKAWVEKELKSNKWYTLATPLQDTYAGDMYVPKVGGRQKTEAFTEIKFNTTDYSRNAAPIYQRSWDRADSKMLMNDNGSVKEEKADISYTNWESADETTTSLLESNWGHVYNDMGVKYYNEGSDKEQPRYGFALKVGNEYTEVGTGEEGKDKVAMIRLPKADKEYDYYYANDTKDASTAKNVEVTKTNYGKLLMDKDNVYKAESNEYGSITQKLVNSSSTSGNGIYLVSNPYMKTLDMVKFFNMNPNLEKKFWIIRDNEVKAANAIVVTQSSSDQTTVTDTYMPAIKPLESFFVKVASDATTKPTTVTFNTNITTSTEYVYQKLDETSASQSKSSSSAPRFKTRSGMSEVPQAEMFMTATNSAGRSTAKLSLREDADNDFVDSEDVETLFDSNLTDLPTLYTVAGNEAVSINTMEDIDMLPVGIVSSTEGDVDVTISGASSLGEQLWLFDSKTGTTTSLDDDATVTMTSNAHGRYYITTRSSIDIKSKVEAESSVKAYSPAIHTLVVSALGSTITSVKVFTTDGRVIAEENVNGDSTTMTTISGVNIVRVETANGTETIKVNVR